MQVAELAEMLQVHPEPLAADGDSAGGKLSTTVTVPLVGPVPILRAVTV